MADTETIVDRRSLERAHAEAIKFLLDHGDIDEALRLGRASITRIEVGYAERAGLQEFVVYLTAPPDIREQLELDADVLYDAATDEYAGPGPIQAAFGSVTSIGRAELVDMFPSVHVAAPADEVGRHQGTAREAGRYEYRGTRYRSKTEIRVAEALDDANVLYFPLPIGLRHFLRIAEPDFLVIHLGRVGVLEIDGPTHTPLTRAKESAKDAKLIQSGVRLVHHVEVADVDRDPKVVVDQFLALLRGPIY